MDSDDRPTVYVFGSLLTTDTAESRACDVDKCVGQLDYTGRNRTNSLRDNNHSHLPFFVFFTKSSRFYKFCKTSFLFL